jgi:hypothetical protein
LGEAATARSTRTKIFVVLSFPCTCVMHLQVAAHAAVAGFWAKPILFRLLSLPSPRPRISTKCRTCKRNTGRLQFLLLTASACHDGMAQLPVEISHFPALHATSPRSDAAGYRILRKCVIRSASFKQPFRKLSDLSVTSAFGRASITTPRDPGICGRDSSWEVAWTVLTRDPAPMSRVAALTNLVRAREGIKASARLSASGFRARDYEL